MNIYIKWTSCLVPLLLVCSSVSIAKAGSITTFTDRTDFNTAVGATPLTIEDFTDDFHFPISTGILNSKTDLVVEVGPPITPGDIEPGVTYSTPIGSSSFFNIDVDGGFTGGFLDGFYGGDPNRVLTIEFDNKVSAFGFDTNQIMGSDFDLTIKFASGPDFVQNFSTNSSENLEFFGFQSSTIDILSVFVDGNGNDTFAFALDNFTFDQAVPVPEPSFTLSLLALGTLGASSAVLRKRKQSEISDRSYQ